MSDSRMDEIRARWAKATPGPWEVREVDGVYAIAEPDGWVLDGEDNEAANAVAVAAAPEDIAYLLARAEHGEAAGFSHTGASGLAVEAVRTPEGAFGFRLRGEARDTILTPKDAQTLIDGMQFVVSAAASVLMGEERDEARGRAVLAHARVLAFRAWEDAHPHATWSGAAIVCANHDACGYIRHLTGKDPHLSIGDEAAALCAKHEHEWFAEFDALADEASDERP